MAEKLNLAVEDENFSLFTLKKGILRRRLEF